MIKLKVQIFLIISCCCSATCQNHNTYFYSFDPVPGIDFRADKASNIWAIDSLLFIMNGFINDEDGRTMEIFVLDANDKSILNHLLIEGPQNDLAIPSQGAYKVSNSGDIIVVGEWYDYVESRMHICLARLSSDLNIEWFNYFPELSEFNIYGYAVAETEQGDILVSMTEQVSDNPLLINLRVIKTNAAGDLIWNKIIVDTFNTIGAFGDLNRTDDGDYVVNAATVDFANHPGTPWNTIVHKFDSSGTVLWSRVMAFAGFLRQDGQSTTLENGGAAVCWRKDTTWFDWINVNDEFPVLYGLDRNGQTLWRHEWYDVSIRAVNRIITARNGDILGSGVYAKEGSKGKSWLFRISADGEVLWERHYSDSIQRPWSPHLEMLDLCEMDDGRIAATGIVLDTNEMGDINYNIGLIVVDSNGCITPDCKGLLHYITNVDRPLLGSYELPLISCNPNPASTVFRVTLPKDFRHHRKQCELRIYSHQGTLIQSTPWEIDIPQMEIPCINWPQGLYLVFLFDNGIPLVSGKIAIAR